MKWTWSKMIAVAAVLALVNVMAVPQSVQAMLVPAQFAQAGQDKTSREDLQTLEKALESKALTGKLHALGLSDAEIQARLSRLSDAQKHQLASQIRAVHPAGDGGGFIVGILLIAVLVLLIIYLAKRV